MDYLHSLIDNYITDYRNMITQPSQITDYELQHWCDYLYDEILNDPMVPVQIIDSPDQLKQLIDSNTITIDNFTIRKINHLEQMIVYMEHDITNFVYNTRSLVETDIIFYQQLFLDNFDFHNYERHYNRIRKALTISYSLASYIIFIDCMLQYHNYKPYWIHTFDWFKQTLNIGGILPLNDRCIIIQKPIIRLNEHNQLHADGEYAIEFADGTGVPILNGIRVPKYLALTPANQIDINNFLKERNADVRTEFVRKLGVDRLLKFGKLMDTFENHKKAKNYDWYKKSEYKLYDMKALFNTNISVPYLYMKNQSVPNTFHLECCAADRTENQVKTILQALKFRFGGIDPEKIEIVNIK